MAFKKRENNQKNTEFLGKKRRIFGTIALLWTLVFGKTRSNFSESSNSNFNRKAIQEIVIDNEQLSSLKKDDQTICLNGIGDSAPSVPTLSGTQYPSNFPTPGRNRPSRPIYSPKYRIPPRTAPKVTSTQGLNARANPTGANPAGGNGGGNGGEFDNEFSASNKNQQTQKSTRNGPQSKTYNSNKKKKKNDQCLLEEKNIAKKIEVNEKFEAKPIERLIETALENQKVQREYESIKKRISEGVNPINIGKNSTKLTNNKILIKGAHGRYILEINGNQVNILGIGARGNSKNMKTFEKLMNEMYNLNLKY